MGEKICELCQYESELGATEKHHVVPTGVTEQAGIPESKIVRLCCNCHREVHTWYSAKVVNLAYDPGAKRFKVKSWLEMVKEYQSAFDGFMRYKKEQKKAD